MLDKQHIMTLQTNPSQLNNYFQQSLPQQSNNLLKIFNEQQQYFRQNQQKLHLQTVTNAFSQLKIKHQTKYNPNKFQHSIIQIQTIFNDFIAKIQFLKFFCQDYRMTLKAYLKEQQNQTKIKRYQNNLKIQNQENTQKDKQIQMNQNQKILPFLKVLEHQKYQQSISKNIYLNNQFNNDMQIQNQQIIRKPLIVLPIKTIHPQDSSFSLAINKLKVMIVKVNTKNSTAYQYCYPTYVSKLIQALNSSNLDIKRYKNQRVKKLLNYLHKKYVILDIRSSNIYPYHPTRYFMQNQLIQQPVFFINFYVQQLLFINSMPIKLKQSFSDLFYCPIILQKSNNFQQINIFFLETENRNKQTIEQSNSEQSLCISEWYLTNLTFIDSLWQSKLLIVKVYHLQTSINYPIIYSHMNFKKFIFPEQLRINYEQQNIKGFNFMTHEYKKQKQILQKLQQIKQYIYSELIFNHLLKVFYNLNNNSNFFNQLNTKKNEKIKIHTSNSIKIPIDGGFVIEICLQKDMKIKQTLIQARNGKNLTKNIFLPIDQKQLNQNCIPLPYFNLQLMTNLLLFYKRKNIFSFKTQQLKQQIEINIKNTLFKILAEKIQYRVINSAYQGSLGLYYYDKKNIRRQNVNQFFQQFNQNN